MTPLSSRPLLQDLSWRKILIIVIFCLGAAFSLAILLVEFFYLDGAIQKDNIALGGDFSNLWVGGRLALAGDLTSLFEPLAFNRAMAEMLPRQVLPYNNVWSYPPTLLLPVLPFAALPFTAAYVLWMGAAIAFFIWAARAATGGNAWLWLLLSPAAIANIMPGQNGFWSAALMIAGFFLMKRRPLLAGVLFGLLAFKPQLGLLVPLILILDRNWIAFASAGALVIAQAIAVTALFGTDIWPLFLEHVMPLQTRLLEEGSGPLFANLTSFFIAARVAGLGLDGAYLFQILAAIAGVVGLIRVWRRTRDITLRFAVFVTATFLVTPYAASYDLIPASLAVWMLLPLESRRWRLGETTALAFAWCVPLIMTLLVICHVGVPLAPFAIAGLFLVVLQRAREEPLTSVPAGPSTGNTCP